MWVTNTDYDPEWEPDELRILKQKLANLKNKSCKCLKKPADYDTPKRDVSYNIKYGEKTTDKDLQVGSQGTAALDQSTQINLAIFQQDRIPHMETITKNVLCPSCYVNMSLMWGGALRIIKDEESETNYQMFSCDKSTEKCVDAIETTTSTALRPAMKCSNITLNGSLSDSDVSWHHESKQPQMKVTFMEDSSYEQEPSSPTPSAACICLEKFIDSIRPPILNYGW